MYYLIMERKPVQSSNLKSIGWEDNILEIEFHSNAIWQYIDVPFHIYEELMGASSHGSFFARNIKGVYGERNIS